MGKKKKSDHDRLEEYAGEKRWCVAASCARVCIATTGWHSAHDTLPHRSRADLREETAQL